MTPTLLDQCTAGAFDGSVPFPETIRKITADGVEWYRADLIRGGKTYYGTDLRSYYTPWPEWSTPEVADSFNGESVLAAIRASQAGQIDFREFLRRAVAAGVVSYTVHVRGRKVVYTGRHGDAWVEPIPAV